VGEILDAYCWGVILMALLGLVAFEFQAMRGRGGGIDAGTFGAIAFFALLWPVTLPLLIQEIAEGW
jgi:hypothetical protein